MSEHVGARRGRSALVVAAMVMAISLVAAAGADARTLGERNSQVRLAAKAQGAPLQFGKWTVFDFNGVGSVTILFTFQSDVPVLLRVTDAFCRGDEFTVFDRGAPIFGTLTVGTDPSCDDVPLVETGPLAWADQSYSKGKMLLPAGRHRVKMKATESPFGFGSGFVRIDKRP